MVAHTTATPSIRYLLCNYSFFGYAKPRPWHLEGLGVGLEIDMQYVNKYTAHNQVVPSHETDLKVSTPVIVSKKL